MLATLIEAPFDSAEWIFETKWDGYRAIAELDQQKVQLYSRNGLSFNKTFSPIVAELEKLTLKSAVLDGEIVVEDQPNQFHFHNIQNYQSSKAGIAIYQVFDLLYLEGYDLRDFPLIKRKELLKAAVKDSKHVKVCSYEDEHGIDFFKKVAQQGGEGIVAKHKQSEYTAGRGRSWLKIKTHLRQEVLICGFTPPQGSRRYFGALMLGVYDQGELVYIGNTGSGFDQKSLKDVYQKLNPLIQGECPFKPKPKTRFSPTWVKPKLICEVSFAEWTKDNHLRQAIFQGLRVDKDPQEVTKEHNMAAAKVIQASKPKEQVIGKNLDKVFWPAEGYTKGDLLNYYKEVAPLILPYLKDRPETLLRYPNGIEGPHFYQKDSKEFSETVRTVKIQHEEGPVNYLLIDDIDSLLFTVNLGCIDLHPLNGRVGYLDHPDYLIMDLDPEEISFEEVIKAAQEIHHLLEEWEVPSVCKTSGATGLHIFIPLGAQYTFEQVTQFGKLIAYRVHERLPHTTSVERHVAKRRNRVYLDFLQNRRGANVAAVYSVRPRPGAPVSTPLKWSEVSQRLSPANFTIKTVLKRFEKVGDLFQPVLGKGIDIKKILAKQE